jgi:hypothetical protein
MATTTPTRIRLQLTCEDPPLSNYDGQPTEFGLQDKQQALHAGVSQPDGAIRFACEVAVKPHATTSRPDFGGPFAHGPAGARFLYLGWRPPGGAWIRRFKIPLTPISWEQIAAAQAGALAARVSATRSGTVALQGAGWTASDDL